MKDVFVILEKALRVGAWVQNSALSTPNAVLDLVLVHYHVTELFVTRVAERLAIPVEDDVKRHHTFPWVV